MAPPTILEVRDLRTYFDTFLGVVKAVDGVSFSLSQGETLSFVGESGSGKSAATQSIIKLVPCPPGRIVGGEVRFKGADLMAMTERELRALRGGKISTIFQEPMTSLNPLLRISTHMMETIRLHQGLNKKEAFDKSLEMLDLVGIPEPRKRIAAYPHQLSGGMRQRVMIAMALSCNPEILIADEPTSALDVTIQAQILELIAGLTERLGTAVIMITHDLGVVAGVSDRVAVMYAGRIIETGPVRPLFEDPRHPYTVGLMHSVPRLDSRPETRLHSIPGSPPNLIGMPDCCRFFPRCRQAREVCRSQYPPLSRIDQDRTVSCWLHAEGA